MKAILINQAGFHKDIHTGKKVLSYRQFKVDAVNVRPYDEIIDKELTIPIIEFIFEREYEDEWGERVLIYREYGN